jgi:hypothetical protein
LPGRLPLTSRSLSMMESKSTSVSAIAVTCYWLLVWEDEGARGGPCAGGGWGGSFAWSVVSQCLGRTRALAEAIKAPSSVTQRLAVVTRLGTGRAATAKVKARHTCDAKDSAVCASLLSGARRLWRMARSPSDVEGGDAWRTRLCPGLRGVRVNWRTQRQRT